MSAARRPSPLRVRLALPPNTQCLSELQNPQRAAAWGGGASCPFLKLGFWVELGGSETGAQVYMCVVGPWGDGVCKVSLSEAMSSTAPGDPGSPGSSARGVVLSEPPRGS